MSSPLDFFHALESTLEPVFDYQTFPQLDKALAQKLQELKLLKQVKVDTVSCDKCDQDEDCSALEIGYDEPDKRYYYSCRSDRLKNPVWLPDEAVIGWQFEFDRLTELICAKSKLKPSNNSAYLSDIDFNEIAYDEIKGETVSVGYSYDLSKGNDILESIDLWRVQVKSKLILIIVPNQEILRRAEIRLLEQDRTYLVTLKTLLENDFDVLSILNTRIPKAKPIKTPVTFPMPAGTKWEDITMEFVSNDSVKISVKGTSPQRFTFAEMGFKDRRKGDLPNKLWEILKDIAKDHGILSWRSSRAKPKLQKTISRLRDQLQKFFTLTDDPFLNYRQKEAWQTKFKIEDLSYSPTPETPHLLN